MPRTTQRLPLSQRMLLRLALLAVVLGGLWVYDHYIKPQPPDAAAPQAEMSLPAERPATPSSSTDSLVIQDLELRDERGRVLYRGEVDLAPTLERIAANERLRFPNDGSTFQNRERRLPRQRSGYYREWVVPTPGDDGPGPQRIVTGAEGEVWYTSDHYRSFRRISYDWP